MERVDDLLGRVDDPELRAGLAAAIADDDSAEPATPRASKFEVAIVALMSLTAVLTAWTGFQASRWSSEVSTNTSRASALRIESTRWSTTADRQRQTDIAIFTAWIEAVADDDRVRIDFIRDRFPARLEAATAVWIAADPLDDPDAPLTPFELEEYVVDADGEATRLLEEAETASAAANGASERADRYVTMTVVFAVVLFFAAMSSKLASRLGRTVLFDLAVVGLVVGAVVLATLPTRL